MFSKLDSTLRAPPSWNYLGMFSEDSLNVQHNFDDVTLENL